MPRARLGVALLVPEPVATEIDGLRRALGDGALGRIPAHLTLVPPVNVALDRLEEAAVVLREAAAGCAGPLDLALGPAATFWPVTPVVYLDVSGDVEGLRSLRDRVFREPLARALTYDFVPHVTLADEVASPERIGAAVAALADYRSPVLFPAVQLLREGPGRIWEPIAEEPLGGGRVVGRGGLPLELAAASRPDTLLAGRLGEPSPVVVTARREGEAIGSAHAILPASEPGVAWLVGLVVAPHARRTGVGRQLLKALAAALTEQGVSALRVPRSATGQAAGFLEHVGFAPVDAGLLERRL